MSASRRWAEQIAECAPLSVRASKQCAMEGLQYGGVKAASEAQYEAVHAMLKSKDFIEGPMAFAQKRKPNWSGE
jgi:enoyl-CoA hydratase/carnithine racemase